MVVPDIRVAAACTVVYNDVLKAGAVPAPTKKQKRLILAGKIQ
jgi:hypothetical protein